MKTIRYCLLALSLTLTSLAALASQWEYHVKSYLLISDDQYIANEMNKLGTQGWELVNCTTTNDGGKVLCSFKREKSQ